jgi:hypothetical protein
VTALTVKSSDVHLHVLAGASLTVTSGHIDTQEQRRDDACAIVVIGRDLIGSSRNSGPTSICTVALLSTSDRCQSNADGRPVPALRDTLSCTHTHTHTHDDDDDGDGCARRTVGPMSVCLSRVDPHPVLGRIPFCNKRGTKRRLETRSPNSFSSKVEIRAATTNKLLPSSLDFFF